MLHFWIIKGWIKIKVIMLFLGKLESYTSMEFPMKRVTVTSSNGTGGHQMQSGTTFNSGEMSFVGAIG